MRQPKTMAIPLSEWREQEARADKMQRLAKLAVATVCIVGAAAYWQDITAGISAMTPAAKDSKTMPVSSHRQTFGTPAPASPKPATAVKTSAKPDPVGVHPNSEKYQANAELEHTLLRDHGAQKEVAKMISTTYRIPLKTATLIVATSVVESKKQEIDPFLVLALMGQESSYNKSAESHFGAQGLMQVRPELHSDSMKKTGVKDILAAPIGKQIELGTMVFKKFLSEDKPVELGLQHYNQGEYAKKIDPTLKYANLVLSKREALTATVANYVQESALSDSNLKPNS